MNKQKEAKDIDSMVNNDFDNGGKKNGNRKGNQSYRKRGNNSRNNKNHKQVDRQNSEIKSRENDFGWYNTLPELTNAAANFPFARPLGVNLTYTSVDAAGQDILSGLTKEAIPGIMIIHWNPTIGVCLNGVSPANIISREIYSFVRHANSGAANYDAPDMMIYLLAMDTIYSMYQNAARVYGLINMYTKQNRYMPKELIKGLGFDFDSVIGNAAQFLWYINQICYKISSFAVPNFMSYYLRHMWMNEGVYLDKDNSKAQMYAFKQDGGYQFDPRISSATFASLKYFEINPIDMTGAYDLFTPQSWYEQMCELINPILASEDMGIMSGDILKAFGSNNLFTVNPVPDTMVVVPTYKPEVLSQIQNLTISGLFDTENKGKLDSTTYYNCDIVQTIDGKSAEGYLVHNPPLKTLDSVLGDSDLPVALGIPTIAKLVTSDEEVPSTEFVMVATRLTETIPNTFALKDGSGGLRFGFEEGRTCGSELVSHVEIITLTAKGTESLQIGTYGLLFGDGDIRARAASFLERLSKFDWNPTLPICHTTGSGADQTFYFDGYFQDTNNYCIMTCDDLNRLHEAALMSEFYVPQIGSGVHKALGNKEPKGRK